LEEEINGKVDNFMERQISGHFTDQLSKMSELLKKVVVNHRLLQEKMGSLEKKQEILSLNVNNHHVPVFTKTSKVSNASSTTAGAGRSVSPSLRPFRTGTGGPRLKSGGLFSPSKRVPTGNVTVSRR
jgi:hypothetical protein